MQAPAPQIADHHCRDPSVAKPLDGEGGKIVAAFVMHCRDHAGARFDLAHAVEHLEGGHRFQPRFFLAFIVAQARPRLEPAFAGEVELEICRRLHFDQVVEIDGQHVAHRRAFVFALMKGLRAAEHEESAAALGNKFLQQGHLVAREKIRFEVIHYHRVIAVEFLGRLGKTAHQFRRVARVEAHEHRLVVAFDLFLRLIAEAAEERVARFARPPDEFELRLAFGDPNQADQLNLLVLRQRAIQEFVFPVRPARDI